jgi:hypothetical protein
VIANTHYLFKAYGPTDDDSQILLQEPETYTRNYRNYWKAWLAQKYEKLTDTSVHVQYVSQSKIECLNVTTHTLVRPLVLFSWLCSPARAMASSYHEVSWSHTHTHTHTHEELQSVGLLWTGDQLVAETST